MNTEHIVHSIKYLNITKYFVINQRKCFRFIFGRRRVSFFSADMFSISLPSNIVHEKLFCCQTEMPAMCALLQKIFRSRESFVKICENFVKILESWEGKCENFESYTLFRGNARDPLSICPRFHPPTFFPGRICDYMRRIFLISRPAISRESAVKQKRPSAHNISRFSFFIIFCWKSLACSWSASCQIKHRVMQF